MAKNFTTEALLKDFREWSGGFDPHDVTPEQIDTYVELRAPANWNRDALDDELTELHLKE